MILLLCLLLQAAPVKVADGAKVPSLAMDADGNVYVAFSRGGNIEVAISLDGGATFSAPVRALNVQGRDPGSPFRPPRISVDAQKRIYVSAPLCLTGPDLPVVNDIYYTVSPDKGKTWKGPYPVSEPKTGVESAHAAAAGPGDLHLAWLSGDGQRAPTLAYAKYGADGKRSGKAVIVAKNPCEKCPPAIAVDGKGNPWIAYRETGKENRAIWLAASTDGGRSFAAPTKLNSVDSGIDDCPVEAPSLAVTSDGKTLAAAWMDLRSLEKDPNVYWSFGPPGKLSRDTDPHDDRRYTQRRPSLAIEPDGTVWCAWEDGRLSTQRIFFASSKDPANFPLGTAKDPGYFSPALAVGGGKVGIAYQSGDTVAFKQLK